MAAALDAVSHQLAAIATGNSTDLEVENVTQLISLYRKHIARKNQELLRQLLTTQDIETLSLAMTARRQHND